MIYNSKTGHCLTLPGFVIKVQVKNNWLLYKIYQKNL
jgi:hypothetical protein